MTASTQVGTGVDVLYLEIDLGSEPSLETFAVQARNLADLGGFCIDVLPRMIETERPDSTPPHRLRRRMLEEKNRSGLKIMRTSLASPWVTVIADTAKSYAPVGIGVSAMYGLHHLLKMVMEWQRHREDIKERRSARSIAERHVKDAVTDYLMTHPSGPVDSGGEDPIVKATEAIRGIRTITANELVEMDDPRVRG